MIDEAHSSQGGKTSAAINQALGEPLADDETGPDPEATVNDALTRRIDARKMLTNASYFAFTATPKPKTLEMFGEPLPPDAEDRRVGQAQRAHQGRAQGRWMRYRLTRTAYAGVAFIET